MGRRALTNLNDDERKAIAENVKDGGHVKQIAAKWQVSPGYVYACVNEFLLWKLEWKMKE